VKPSGEERRAYRAAENRLKESIYLRGVLPDHSYSRRLADLETMKRYHRLYGVPDLGLWARAKRLMGSTGGDA
jgi:hypothetical protein